MVEVSLANGRGTALVDDEDAPAVLRHRWYLLGGRYAAGVVSGRKQLMHRFILGIPVGDSREVDHIEVPATLDNRRSNLRIVDHAQNQQNVRSRTGSTSTHRGVSWCAYTGRWRAVGTISGRYTHLGRFDTEAEAAEVASSWRAEHMPFSSDAALA